MVISFVKPEILLKYINDNYIFGKHKFSMDMQNTFLYISLSTCSFLLALAIGSRFILPWLVYHFSSHEPSRYMSSISTYLAP